MTLPASGPLQLGTQSGGSSINSEFGYGNDLQSYLGVYYGKNGVEYRFPLPGNSISMGGSSSPNDAGFYSTQKITGGNATYYSSTSITVPLYNQITVTCVGGSGGSSGGVGVNCSGSYVRANLGSGGSGYVSSFGGYVSAGGGAGGSNQSYQFVPGDPGGVSSTTYTNPVQDGGGGPPSGASVYVTVGGGGPGGRGADTRWYYGGNCYYQYPGADVQAPGGSGGSAGYVQLVWA